MPEGAWARASSPALESHQEPRTKGQWRGLHLGRWIQGPLSAPGRQRLQAPPGPGARCSLPHAAEKADERGQSHETLALESFELPEPPGLWKNPSMEDRGHTLLKDPVGTYMRQGLPETVPALLPMCPPPFLALSPAAGAESQRSSGKEGLASMKATRVLSPHHHREAGRGRQVWGRSRGPGQMGKWKGPFVGMQGLATWQGPRHKGGPQEGKCGGGAGHTGRLLVQSRAPGSSGGKRESRTAQGRSNAYLLEAYWTKLHNGQCCGLDCVPKICVLES